MSTPLDDVVQKLLDPNPVLSEKICRAIECSPANAPAALKEVLRFMELISQNESGRLTPSLKVDLVWHEFILFTRLYHDFCDETFGRMIHHSPGGSQSENADQFQRTLTLYAQRFGTPNPDFWQDGQSCGLCDG